MSEYESADLFFSHFSLSIAIFTGFISVTSALVVATYIGGHMIPQKLAAFICVLYTSCSTFLILGFQRNGAVLVSLREQMPNWHITETEPAWVLPLGVNIGTLTVIFIAIAALYYFANAQFRNKPTDEPESSH